ncbi:MAG: hypothetical protein ACOYMB_04635 [Patescibacteria group bacterium]
MSEEEKIIEELDKIKKNFNNNLLNILSNRDQKISKILKKESEEKYQKISSELSS